MDEEPYGVYTAEVLKELVDSAVFKEISQLKKEVMELLNDARKMNVDARREHNNILALVSLDHEDAYQRVLDIIEERENS